ncbi:MHS family MFS transporter [Leucobacter sp. cx-42]|uniref:MFS transporter n=1 Tax=unclassified Leucobacter TaxID=2621730 RepID=UPI00165E4CA9|nr:MULTISPECIES: MFS transporter [unclassified Leucobacter]MBC9954134.1 MHS family MFS transporter [Leucobacter sp. cx-42]
MSSTAQSTAAETNSHADRETATVNVISERDAKRASIGALIGNVLEWYDYFLFNTAAALVFNVQFFVSDNAATAAMASFATLAVGFVVRPLGGLFFGALGDRIGRKSVLMITVTGIGVATGLIGILPTYVSIGIWAPIFLIVLRMAQGAFIGGEWSGAMTLAVENAPLHMRARMAALPQLGSPIATLLSSGGFFLLALFLSQDSFDSWGWRIPFLLAIPLLVLAIYIRKQMHESPVFKDLEKSGDREKTPLKTVFVKGWKHLLISIAAALLGTAGFYIITTFVMNYGTRVLGIERNVILMATLIGAVFQLGAVIHAGHLGQKFGATKVIVWSGVLTIIAAFPCFMLIETTNPVFVTIGVIIGVSLLTYSFAAVGPVITGLFPSTIRLSGVSVGFNGANLISGFTPLVATALVTATNDAWWPAAMLLVLFAVLSVIGGLLAPKFSQQYEGYKH